MCSPPQVKSPSITIYPSIPSSTFAHPLTLTSLTFQVNVKSMLFLNGITCPVQHAGHNVHLRTICTWKVRLSLEILTFLLGPNTASLIWKCLCFRNKDYTFRDHFYSLLETTANRIIHYTLHSTDQPCLATLQLIFYLWEGIVSPVASQCYL